MYERLFDMGSEWDNFFESTILHMNKKRIKQIGKMKEMKKKCKEEKEKCKRE